MKILIRDDNDSGFRAVPIKLKFEGGSTYNINVQVHQEEVAEPQVEITQTPEPGDALETAVSEEPIAEADPDAEAPAQESVFPQPKSPHARAKKPRRKPGAPVLTKTIEIKITLPALPKQLPTRDEIFTRLKQASRRRLIAVSAAIVALIVVIVVTQWPSGGNGAQVAGSNRPELQRGTPSYPTVLPAGKSINQLGGWVRISPPDRAPVYTYVDRIGTTQINVSEQPLPKAFKADPQDQVAQLAQNFNATQKVTAGSTVVYIGTDEKGPQSVIFTKNDLLVLIKSTDTLTPNDWVQYVSSLQ